MCHFDAKSVSNFNDSNVSIFDSLKQRATEKNPKNSDTRKIAVIILNFEQRGSTI